MEHRISVLEDQLLEKNIIFQGLAEDEFDDIGDTKAKIILVLATVNEGATAEDRKEVAKKNPIDSIERMGKFNAHRPRPVKVKFVNKSDISNLFRNRKKLPDGIFNNNNNNNLFYSVIVVIISHSVCDATCKCRVGRSIRRSLSAYGSSITKYNFHYTV